MIIAPRSRTPLTRCCILKSLELSLVLLFWFFCKPICHGGENVQLQRSSSEHSFSARHHNIDSFSAVRFDHFENFASSNDSSDDGGHPKFGLVSKKQMIPRFASQRHGKVVVISHSSDFEACLFQSFSHVVHSDQSRNSNAKLLRRIVISKNYRIKQTTRTKKITNLAMFFVALIKLVCHLPVKSTKLCSRFQHSKNFFA